MEHSPGFLKIVADAKTRVREISVDQTRAWLAQNPKVVLLDVREDSEWNAGHAAEAIHLGKGILERDLGKNVPRREHGNHHVLRRRLPFRPDLRCRAKDGLSQRPLTHRRLQGAEGIRLADEGLGGP
ncbi:MAG: rhodanese-like domain-containing protein [Limisphaerales bacterium]